MRLTGVVLCFLIILASCKNDNYVNDKEFKKTERGSLKVDKVKFMDLLSVNNKQQKTTTLDGFRGIRLNNIYNSDNYNFDGFVVEVFKFRNKKISRIYCNPHFTPEQIISGKFGSFAFGQGAINIFYLYLINDRVVSIDVEQSEETISVFTDEISQYFDYLQPANYIDYASNSVFNLYSNLLPSNTICKFSIDDDKTEFLDYNKITEFLINDINKLKKIQLDINLDEKYSVLPTGKIEIIKNTKDFVYSVLLRTSVPRKDVWNSQSYDMNYRNKVGNKIIGNKTKIETKISIYNKNRDDIDLIKMLRDSIFNSENKKFKKEMIKQKTKEKNEMLQQI